MVDGLGPKTANLRYRKTNASNEARESGKLGFGKVQGERVDWESVIRKPERMDNGMRVGSVPYLYAEPLLYGLRDRNDVSVQRAYPEALAQQYVAGDCAAALLPVLDAVRKTRGRIVPGLGVCAEGPAKSERLLCRVPAEEVWTLGILGAPDSIGSVARILLAEVFSVRPRLVEEDADALLVTGDAGLTNTENHRYDYDLGDLWARHTGLPLVLGVWSLGSGVQASQARAMFARALQIGLENLEAIACERAKQGDLTEEAARAYLTGTLRYRLAGAEVESLRLLVALGAKHGFCAEDPELTFC